MSGNGNKYRIVLENPKITHHRAISESISECFDIPPAQALQIVQGAPIVLLSHLNMEQATGVSHKLGDIKVAGGELVIEQHGARKISAITWPKVPKVLQDSDIAPEAKIVVVRCPECSASIKLDLNEVLIKANKKASLAAKPAEGKAVVSSGAKPVERKKVEMKDDDSSLISDMKPLIDAGAHGTVGSLKEFESGLIDLYETEVDDFDK